VAKRSSKKRVADKAVSAAIGAESGAIVAGLAFAGNPVAIGAGALIGAAGGLYYGDQIITFREPMIIIPAREQYLLSGTPSVTIYAHAGETLYPSGGNVQDNFVGVAEGEALIPTEAPKRKKTNKYTRFNKKFNYRAKKSNESSMNYMKARNKAVSAAWRKQ
jgi:hypothetical protein